MDGGRRHYLRLRLRELRFGRRIILRLNGLFFVFITSSILLVISDTNFTVSLVENFMVFIYKQT
jgi:hypothetical protein